MGTKKICLIIIPIEERSKSQQKSVLLSYVRKKDQIYDFGWKVGHTPCLVLIKFIKSMKMKKSI